jgi:ABC-type enterochelin transport system, ATPase component
MIEIKNISKKYGEQLVLDAVTTTIKKGSITSFIGPNGAGKSTLLSIITQLLKADNGEIIIDGKNLKDFKAIEFAKKVSILKQQNHLQVKLTVRDLIAFGRYPYSKGRLNKEDELLIQEAINYMQLSHLEDKFIDTLSGGEKQRAFIAMVIAQDTDYIFLDEPLNNLDMKHSVEIMTMLRKLCDEKNKTVIIVIHDINFASCYSDYILALKKNKIYINDTTEKVIQENILEKVYDMPFNVSIIEGNRICVYFQP